MTYPPQGSDERGRDDAAEPAGPPEPAPPADATRPYAPPPYVPAPSAPPAGYGQTPSYGASEPYHPNPPDNPNPPYGGNPPYGQPPAYGQAPAYGRAPAYGQAPQYGAPQYGTQPYGTQQYGASPYGVPGQQFGPPPAAPAQKSRVGLIAILTVVALLVIAGAVVLVMSLRSTVLDAASAERDVAAQFEQRAGVAIDLTCPGDMKVKAGATYTCRGKTADGESVTLKLTITDEKTAAYTWTEP
jgi:uncharacterized membrane protein